MFQVRFRLEFQELEAGGFTASYIKYFSAVFDVCCTLMIGMYIQFFCIKRFDIIFYSFRCEILMCSSSFFYSNTSFFLFSPSKFFLMTIWGFDTWVFGKWYRFMYRCREPDCRSFSPGRYSGIRAIGLMINLGSVVWLNRDGVSSTLDWVECIYGSAYLYFGIKLFLKLFLAQFILYIKKVKFIIVWENCLDLLIVWYAELCWWMLEYKSEPE